MQRKNLVMIIISIICILIGIGFFIYPYISNSIYEKDVSTQKQEFVLNVKSQNNSNKLDELYQKLKIENEQLFAQKQSNLVDPFSYEQQSINLDEYGLKNNTIGYVRIPKMQVELPIILGANKQNMSKGAVHLTQTSYPIGGINTNCVLAAHRGYAKAAFFRDIEKLDYGDKIYIQNFKEELTYEVFEIQVIDPTDVNKMLIRPGEDMVTLITCHPYRHNYQRYAVFCKRAN